MEDENSQERPLDLASMEPAATELIVEQPASKNVEAENISEEFNNYALSPLRERIGVYAIATLSVVGLVLIVYTGIRALALSVTTDAAPIVDEVDSETVYGGDSVDIDELAGIIEDIGDELDSYNQENDNELANMDPEDDSLAEPIVDMEPAVTTGIINANSVPVFNVAGANDVTLRLNLGDEVTFVDLDYNIYWSHIEIETDAFGSMTTLQVFVERRFVDVQ